MTIQGCNKALFANSGSLRQDDCAREIRDRTNRIYSDYSIWNPRPLECDKSKKKIAEFAACHETMHFKDGSGNVDACYVNEDSTLRMSCYSGADKKRHQLFPREFKANPGLENGDFIPDMDSFLTRGAIQQRDKRPANSPTECDSISEKDGNYVFMPLIPCLSKTVQDADHIIMPGPQGGFPSRMVRSPEQLFHCSPPHEVPSNTDSMQNNK